MDAGLPGLDGVRARLARAAAELQADSLAASGATGAAGATSGFSNALSDALRSVSRAQNESTSLQQQFQLGAENVSLERTMMAMQNAQVAFQAAMTVRNRLVSAYTDIMNMQV